MCLSFKNITIILSVVWSLSAASVNANTQMLKREFDQASYAFANKNYVVAAKTFKSLSEKNDPNSQYNYALLLFKGVGTPTDLEEAWYWAWRARLNGVERANSLTVDIAKMLSSEEAESLQIRLLAAVELDANAGDPRALSSVAKTYFYVKKAPDYEDGYTWALVAQAFGQEDVLDIIGDAEANLALDQKLKSQRLANEIFSEIVNSSTGTN
ncbi:hypothetical protein N9W03_02260 [Planktomarina temperata]|nr:hypothetical protein [Planktomarina temperata]